MQHRVASRSVLFDGPTGPRLTAATLTLCAGRIEAITPGIAPDAEDLGDDLLMAALVDTHVHINEPGRTEWEGFATATRAAAAGGITTVIDMPLNSAPVTTSLSALEAKIAATEGKLHVDVGFWGGVVPGNAEELRPMAEAGVFGFKCFLCHSGIDDFPKAEPADLRVAMPILREAGVPLLVHAELESELRGSGGAPTDYRTYLHSRPKEWEDRAVALVIELVRETGCPAHIVHLSSATALPLIRAAKREGLPLTVETCPHYLCLTAEEVPPGATEYKCAPPIREQANREALWQALAEGTIDFVVSDHSPCVPGLKLPERGDFLEAWGGIASLQLGLPNVFTEARRRGISLERVAHWLSGAPAAFLGLTDRGLRVGARADLVAWRPEARFVIGPELLEHRHKITPYLGRDVQGAVRHTWVRGHRVLQEGAIVGPPIGRPLLRGLS